MGGAAVADGGGVADARGWVGDGGADVGVSVAGGAVLVGIPSCTILPTVPRPITKMEPSSPSAKEAMFMGARPTSVKPQDPLESRPMAHRRREHQSPERSSPRRRRKSVPRYTKPPVTEQPMA